MGLLHLYRAPGLSTARRNALLLTARRRISPDVKEIQTEYCFNIDSAGELTPEEFQTLIWLLSETFEPAQFGRESFLDCKGLVLEVGPRMNFTTAWSTNAVAVCHACGLHQIRRIERSRRYLLESSTPLTDAEQAAFLAEVHDRMTECRYPEPLDTFETGVAPDAVAEVPVMEEGRKAFERINEQLGLAFDDWDLDYYTDLFRNRIGRNPTNVECFDVAQSNSEHSRHWFFKGRLVVDGQEIPKHLIALIKDTLQANPNNSIIAFRDNSSGIRGYPIKTIIPTRSGEP
ncbi:MAG: phosphoribosylformylglycinamidine synthase, partial [Gemmatimonadales bacterium]|nr:phosphoribosylformylglycinamidine synthase [Gemmatimonadales bacterium]NIN11829.1 phosphoribosylformylglycinamidine synthase [Gemmatimonadales bacterium]NIN50379.1 phosphoribosylformylglycinamidine synthase [Gemmatimonadales bacterium]NIP07843.1 phosphoribosylformylglycinamidine synthase [Gemmatimonadales bacterium]NIR02048.1 phosphoribosylformylglycinamidine synthase [Gemmatimonadales bacterium]